VAEVLIVGGGPVGLFLGALLLQAEVGVRILEQRTGQEPHSRAIGIHPPALEALQQIGVAQELVTQGIPIRRGIAVAGGIRLAEMDFAGVSGTFPFVLSLPQARTAAILEQRVRELDPCALHRGVTFTGLHDDGRKLTVHASSPAGPVRYPASLVLAADGVRSALRALQGTPVRARDYADTYLMGDFADSTGLGPDAALFLEAGGIVESFPLPGEMRRWVVRTAEKNGAADPAPGADVQWLAATIRERTGIGVDPGSNSMLSRFGVRSRLVRRMVAGRTVLIGDAAHEVSPIGGQGMNLGWLDAVALAPLVRAALDGTALDGTTVGAQLRAFERARMRAAAAAVRQSEINMALGRPLPGALLAARNRAIAVAGAVPAVNALAARRFTMQ
jgi:2-polyprenyl-6-methoxyphenol hydroxylase-like FAD-dependent oxidoreductase